MKFNVLSRLDEYNRESEWTVTISTVGSQSFRAIDLNANDTATELLARIDSRSGVIVDMRGMDMAMLSSCLAATAMSSPLLVILVGARTHAVENWTISSEHLRSVTDFVVCPELLGSPVVQSMQVRIFSRHAAVPPTPDLSKIRGIRRPGTPIEDDAVVAGLERYMQDALTGVPGRRMPLCSWVPGILSREWDLSRGIVFRSSPSRGSWASLSPGLIHAELGYALSPDPDVHDMKRVRRSIFDTWARQATEAVLVSATDSLTQPSS